jgi:hypothetical protein
MADEQPQLFDAPAQPAPPKHGLYTPKNARRGDPENARVRALYRQHVCTTAEMPDATLALCPDLQWVPGNGVVKKTKRARGEFNVAMWELARKEQLIFFGETQPSARDVSSPRDARQRKLDAARTPMRHFFMGVDLPHWQLVLVEATLCDLAGMALPGSAYERQAALFPQPTPKPRALVTEGRAEDW